MPSPKITNFEPYLNDGAPGLGFFNILLIFSIFSLVYGG